MAFSNELQTFASGPEAVVHTPSEWLNDPVRLSGFVAGIGDPRKVNTALRQAAFTSAMIGQFTADYGIDNVLDDGDVPKYEANFVAALGRALNVIIPQNLLFEGTDTGTTNAAHVTATTPHLDTFPVGSFIGVKKIATANTTSMTLQVLNVTAPIIWPDGNVLKAGEYPASAEAIFYYDGTNFQLVTYTGKVQVVTLGAGEGIAVGSNLVNLAFQLLVEESVLTATDLFAFYQTIFEGGLSPSHHRKVTWGAMVAAVLALIDRTSKVLPPVNVDDHGPGGKVGNFAVQNVQVATASLGIAAPDYGFDQPVGQRRFYIGMMTSGTNLQAGTVPTEYNPYGNYQVPMHASTPPPFVTFGQLALGLRWQNYPPYPAPGVPDWDWPITMQGTWRLAGWSWVVQPPMGGTVTWVYTFQLYWVRIA